MAKRYRKGSWDGPNNWTSGYTFRKKPMPEDLAWKLLDYIKLCGYAGVPATKKEFLLDFLEKKHLTRGQLPGHLSSLFGAVQDAGIVERKRDGKTHYYVEGINAYHYRNGTLKCTKTISRNAAFRRNIRNSRRTTILPTATISRKIRIKAGSFVMLIPKSGAQPTEFDEDVDYALKNDFGGMGTFSPSHMTFIKRLIEDVTFDEGSMHYCPDRDYYEASPYSLFPYAFLTEDRWGDKWEMMCVKEKDIIWQLT